MILDEAIKHYGAENQINKCLEEVSEFQEALLKTMAGRDSKSHLAEEIADVKIMLTQMEKIFHIELDTEFYTKKKLERLAERIERDRI